MAPEISNGLVCDLLSALFSAQRHSHTQRTVLYMYTHRYTCTAPLNVTALRVAYMYSKRVHPGSFPDPRQRHGLAAVDSRLASSNTKLKTASRAWTERAGAGLGASARCSY